MDCLNNIVGITKTDCECVTGVLTPEQKVAVKLTKSGLTLDDLEGGLNLAGIKDAGACSTFIGEATKALRAAEQRTKDDIIVALSSRYDTGKRSYNGSIGGTNYAGSLTPVKRYQFLKLEGKSIDGVIYLKGARIITANNGETSLKIIKSIAGRPAELLTEIENIQLTANRYTEIPLQEILLPTSLNGSNIDYYLVWDAGESLSIKPKDNKVSCNCGGGTGYDNFISVKGGETDDLEFFPQATDYNHTKGLIIDVSIKCETKNIICNEYDRENAIAVTLAYMVLYKAGEILIESILASNEVTRYTMMNREYLWGKRNHFRKEYNDRVEYLSSVIDINSSDCFVCKNTDMFFSGIIS